MPEADVVPERPFAALPPVASPVGDRLNTAQPGAFNALATNFPVTREIVGARIFEALALAFVRHSPPQLPVPAQYGAGFPDWLVSQGVSGALRYIADVACCERLRTEALFAPAAPVLSGDALVALAPDQLLALKLRPCPATRIGWFATPAMAIWLAHQHGLEDEIAPEWRSGGAIFARQGASVCGFELDRPSHRLLVGMGLGETLGAAAQAASQLYPNFDLGASFGRLVYCGAFAAVKLKG